MSNSVHRIRSSFEALAASPRPILNIPSVPSSINPGPVLPGFLTSEALLRLRSKSRRRNGRLLVEACRDGMKDFVVVNGRLGLDRALGVAKPPTSYVVQSRALPGRVQAEDLRDDPVARALWYETRVVGRTHADGLIKKPDCECKKRSSDADGADGFSGDNMSVAPTSHCGIP